MRSPKILLLAVLVLAALAGCQNRTPQGDPKDAVPVRALIQNLTNYHARFGQLMDMRARVDRQRQKLDSEKAGLEKQRSELERARAQLAKGSMTQAEFDQKWKASGRAARYQKDLDAFQAEVKQHNVYIGQFNRAAEQLSTHLKKRSPADLYALMADMVKLKDTLQDNLDAKDYVKADYVAQHSAVATEFGYSGHH